jgi:hypothetical protein
MLGIAESIFINCLLLVLLNSMFFLNAYYQICDKPGKGQLCHVLSCHLTSYNVYIVLSELLFFLFFALA